jgi:hypothetical protein
MKFLDLIKVITARWYALIAGMIVGGLFAWGGTFFMPPIYESDAVFYVSIDYTQTGMLTDIEEDQVMRGIGDLIFSDETTLAAIEELEGEGVKISKEEFYDDAIFEREEFRWAIRYRDPNPVLAYQVVHAWAHQADILIQNSLAHARTTASYEEVLKGLESCLQRTTQTTAYDDACSVENIDTILTKIDELNGLIAAEKDASRGLFSGAATELVEEPEISVKPMRHQVNILVLSGVFVGLLVCIVLLVIKYKYWLTIGND